MKLKELIDKYYTDSIDYPKVLTANNSNLNKEIDDLEEVFLEWGDGRAKEFAKDENLFSLLEINIRNIREEYVDLTDITRVVALRNCEIENTITLGSLVHLKIENSDIGLIKLVNCDEVDYFILNLCKTKIKFENCKDCAIANLEISNCLIELENNSCLYDLESFSSQNNRGLPDTEDEKYFFTLANLNPESGKRGEASIYDTGLFDFKSKS